MMSKIGVGLLVIGCVASQLPADDGIIIRKNERTLEQIERIYSEIPPVQYTPAAGRWKNLPRTRRRLTEGGSLRMVMLGDSIVNDLPHVERGAN